MARGKVAITVLSITAATGLVCVYSLAALINLPVGLMSSGVGQSLCGVGAISQVSSTSPPGDSTVQLPQATVDYLDNRGVKDRAQQNMARYTYAQQKTGVPWQVVAALHYREAGMSAGGSALDGEPILGYEYTSVDGQTIGATPNDDAANAANALKRLAKGVYGVDVTKNLTLAEWGEAFLAYNRGYLFKRAGVSYTESPYVMNGLDSSHMNMSWSSADTVSGVDGNKAGALAVMSYLGGATGGSQCTNTGGVVPPVLGKHLEITDVFGAPRDGGRVHEGIDIIGGSTIQAILPGTVTVAQDDYYGYGTAVEIDHGNGIRTRYGHMVAGSLLVHVGQTVAAGQALGTMGDTGHSFGVHLHFEVLVQSSQSWQWVDPEKWLAEHGINIPRAPSLSPE